MVVNRISRSKFNIIKFIFRLFYFFISGIRQSTLVNTILWSINISTLAFVTLCTFALSDLENWAIFFPFGLSSVFKATTKTYFAYTGYDLITISSEESVEPSKSVPVALVSQISLVAILYCCVSTAVSLITPYYEVTESYPLISVFGFHNWNWAEYIVTIGALCSLVGLIMGRVLCFSRTIYAMSQDGMLPKIFSKVNKTTQVPVISTIVGSVLVAIVGTFLNLDELTELVSFGNLFNHTLLACAIIIVRYGGNPLLLPDKNETDILLLSSTQESDGVSSETDSLIAKSDFGWNRKNVQTFFLFMILTVVAALFIPPLYLVDIKIVCYFCISGFLSFSVISMGVIIYFAKNSDQQKSTSMFRTPFVPFLPGVSIWLNICIMALFDVPYLLFGLFWVVMGIAVYFAYGMRNSNLKYDIPEATEKQFN